MVFACVSVVGDLLCVSGRWVGFWFVCVGVFVFGFSGLFCLGLFGFRVCVVWSAVCCVFVLWVGLLAVGVGVLCCLLCVLSLIHI